jgi:prevent-host-death family protein
VPKKEPPLVTKSIPVFLARTQFGQIMERVSQNHERFLVTKKGEAKAVILGVEDFLQAIVFPAPAFEGTAIVSPAEFVRIIAEQAFRQT